jgi:hypothetical protein
MQTRRRNLKMKNIREPDHQKAEYQGIRISDSFSDDLGFWSPPPGSQIFWYTGA